MARPLNVDRAFAENATEKEKEKTMSNTLSDTVAAAVAGTITPEFIQTVVTEKAKSLVEDCVKSALGRYSDTGKQIEEAVTEALRVDKLDLPTYGDTVSAMLKAQIEARVTPLLAGQLAADMDELLSLAPKTIKLSEIANQMREPHESDGKYGEVITVHVAHKHGRSAQWVYLDEENHYERRQEYDCEIGLLISEDGAISAARIGGRDTKQTTWIGRSYGLTQLVRSMVACGTKIEIDEDDVITSVGDY